MGPTLKNLNNLLNLPFGCGEQNMANFAPNVYVLKYLSGTDQLTDEIKTQALYYLQTGKQMNSFCKCSSNLITPFKDFSPCAIIRDWYLQLNFYLSSVSKTLFAILQGYQRQLTFKRADKSFSAFGDRDASGSMW